MNTLSQQTAKGVNLDASSAASTAPAGRPDVIGRFIAEMKDLPSSPQILPPLLQILGEEDSDLDKVADLITMDPGLTVKLLVTCNSVAFGGANQVESVAEAIQRLGFKTVYRIVAAEVAGSVFSPDQPGADDPASVLWRQSVLAAFAAQFVADDVGADQAMSFTAGLLHNIGRAVMLKSLSHYYWSFMTETDLLNETESRNMERIRFGCEHGEVGQRLLEQWQFPSRFIAVVANYRNPAGVGETDRQMLAACVGLGSSLGRYVISTKKVPVEQFVSTSILNPSAKDLSKYLELITENMSFVETLCRRN